MVKYLQTIKEEEEHDHEMSQNYEQMMNMGMSPMNSPDKMKRLSNMSGSKKMSFIG